MMGKKALAIAWVIFTLGICIFCVFNLGRYGGQENLGQPRSTTWNYGDRGPSLWGNLDPRFAQCAVGQHQSPVDLIPEQQKPKKPLETIRWDYQPGFGIAKDQGTTLQIKPAAGNNLHVGEAIYPLRQIHFHYPSEHLIGGERYAMEIHFVHQDAEGGVVVLGVMVEVGENNASFGHLLQRWPRARQKKGTVIYLDLRELLPQDLSPGNFFRQDAYFRYLGSLTTPPCSEGVQWLVLTRPLTFSDEQIVQYGAHHPPNARPIQKWQAHGMKDISANS